MSDEEKECIHSWEISGEIRHILPNCPILDCYLSCIKCGRTVSATINIDKQWIKEKGAKTK